jgi:uncharacterized protein YaiL (DUF2058 family)
MPCDKKGMSQYKIYVDRKPQTRQIKLRAIEDNSVEDVNIDDAQNFGKQKKIQRFSVINSYLIQFHNSKGSEILWIKNLDVIKDLFV